MDSLTQLVVGAALGEAALGKKLGNKAVLIGAAAGTLSDLDVIPGAFMDDASRLLFHRGFSHSLAFVLIATPFFSWLFSHFFKQWKIDFREWLLYFGVIFSASILIDAFTTYGTQLLWPLKNRYEFNTIFVADPLFTLPLLISTIWLMFKSRGSRARKIISKTGISLSVIYLLFTVANKQVINNVFEKNLDEQQVAYERMMTNPSPLNQVLWWGLAETDDSFLLGYYSHLDENKNIQFDKIIKNHHLVKPFEGHEPVEKILRFTKGYYVVENHPDGLLVNDLRFGSIKNWETGESTYVFQYLIKVDGGKVLVEEAEKSFEGSGDIFRQLWQRINGKKVF
jgi:inner membrane protein